jgi:hypothetical protein
MWTVSTPPQAKVQDVSSGLPKLVHLILTVPDGFPDLEQMLCIGNITIDYQYTLILRPQVYTFLLDGLQCILSSGKQAAAPIVSS